MSNVNDLMDDLENEIKYMIVDGESVPIRDIVERVISDGKEKKRKLGEG